MSRYYVSKRSNSFDGVCEVPDGQEEIFYHHSRWPELTNRSFKFYMASLAECTHPDTGWWVPLMDEDLLMDEGL